MTVLVEYPSAVSSVHDPCTEVYYPNWSSNGMRGVRCTRRAVATMANATVDAGRSSGDRRVCAIHAKMYERAGWPYDVSRDSKEAGGTGEGRWLK